MKEVSETLPSLYGSSSGLNVPSKFPQPPTHNLTPPLDVLLAVYHTSYFHTLGLTGKAQE